MKCHTCNSDLPQKALWPQFYFCKECSEYLDYNKEQQKEYLDKYEPHFSDDDEIKEVDELDQYV